MQPLKDFRKLQGKSRAEMAEILGISLSLYDKIETGDRTASANFIRKLKKIYPTFDANIFFTP